MPRRRRQRASEIPYELGDACVYSRVSNPGDTREASLETQEERIIIRLRELGYTVTEADVFRDKFTGKETLRRQGLTAMRQAIREGRYKAVGVYKLDRLSRNMGQTFVLLTEMDERRVRPVSVIEANIDDSPEGKLYRMMGGYMAEMELASIEDRFGRGRDHIAERGLPLGKGTPTYGYTFDKKPRTYSFNDLIENARMIFDLAAGGLSGHKVGERLNALGIAPPGLARGMKYAKRGHAGLWNARVIINIIRNPAYKGWCVENRNYSDGVSDAGHSIMRSVPEDDWVVHDDTGRIVPRAVSDEVWDAANRTIDANARRLNSHGRCEHDYILRGMIYCRACGAKMYGLTNQHGFVIYRCSNATLVLQKRRPESCRCEGKVARGRWVEPVVWEEFKRLVLTPGEIERAVRRIMAQVPTDTAQGDLEIARRNLKKQEDARARFFKRWRDEEAKDDCDPELAESWEREYKSLKGPIESLRRTAETLERAASAAVSPEAMAMKVEEKFRVLRERLLVGDDTTTEERRAALVLANTKVICNGDGKRKEPGGAGEIHFYLFDEVATPESSPARLYQSSYLVSLDATTEAVTN